MARFATQRSVREISSLPGCAQVAISHNAFVFPNYRHSAFGLAEHIKGLKEMHRLGYDYALCTVKDGNEAQKRILFQAGWSVLAQFKSTYTGNNIILYGIEFKEREVTEG